MVIKCETGKHYYNTDTHDECPFCRALREGKILFSEEKEDQIKTDTQTESNLVTI